MITTQFHAAPPTKKPGKIADGYLFLATTMDTTTLNMRKLNKWLRAMPDLIQKKECALPGEDLRKAYEQFVSASDALTAEMVANAEAIKKLYEIIQNLEEYGSTTESLSNQ